jgi:hypothetical protein
MFRDMRQGIKRSGTRSIAISVEGFQCLHRLHHLTDAADHDGRVTKVISELHGAGMALPCWERAGMTSERTVSSQVAALQ